MEDVRRYQVQRIRWADLSRSWSGRRMLGDRARAYIALVGLATGAIVSSTSPSLAATSGIPPCTLSEAAGATPTPAPTDRIIDVFGHPNGRNPGPIVVAPDGSAWIGESGRVAHITKSGDYGETSIPFPYADGLAVNRDGDLWIASAQSNAIARMSSKGNLNVYKIPRGNVGPAVVVATPDGSVWFSEEGAIGRWTSVGGFKFFDISDQTSSASSIVVGSDGSIWLADGSSKIRRLTPSGKLMEYSTPQPNAQVGSLGVGASHDIWFSDARAKRIGYISESGVITELPQILRYPPIDLAIGRKGEVWFSERDDNALGRIDATGTVTEYQIDLSVDGMAAAADGTLWLTGDTDKIVKIDPSGSVTRFSTFTGEFCK